MHTIHTEYFRIGYDWSMGKTPDSVCLGSFTTVLWLTIAMLVEVQFKEKNKQ